MYFTSWVTVKRGNYLYFLVLSSGTSVTWGGMEIQACGAYIGTEEESEDSPADPQTQTPEGW